MAPIKHNLVFQNVNGQNVLSLPVRPEGIEQVIITPLLNTLAKCRAKMAVFQNITSIPARQAPSIHANTIARFIHEEQEEPIPVIGSYNAMTGGYE